MKRAELGTIFRYRGVISQVFAINEGHRSLGFKPIDKPPCPTCGHDHRYNVIEGSPLFQENAEAIPTLEES